METRLRCVEFVLGFICIIMLFAVGNQPSEAGLREDLGLVALWTLDEDTIDGNIVEDVFGEYDGTITGDPKTVPGVRGDALSFDGVVDLVQMTNDIFFPSVTVEAFIRPVLGTRNPIYDKYNYGTDIEQLH